MVRPGKTHMTIRRTKGAKCMTLKKGKYTNTHNIIANSSMKYFVAQQTRKGNPLLHFHRKMEQFLLLTATSTPSKIKGKYFCVFMARTVT